MNGVYDRTAMCAEMSVNQSNLFLYILLSHITGLFEF